MGGMWGLISTGLLSSTDLLHIAYGISDHPGWLYDPHNLTLLGNQLVGVLFVFGWTFCMMELLFGMLRHLGWFRVDEIEEQAGMDVGRHKRSAYDFLPWT